MLLIPECIPEKGNLFSSNCPSITTIYLYAQIQFHLIHLYRDGLCFLHNFSHGFLLILSDIYSFLLDLIATPTRNHMIRNFQHLFFSKQIISIFFPFRRYLYKGIPGSQYLPVYCFKSLLSLRYNKFILKFYNKFPKYFYS